MTTRSQVEAVTDTERARRLLAEFHLAAARIERDVRLRDLTDDEMLSLVTATYRAGLEDAGWQDIVSAPKDGTIIDVWREEGGRDTVSWGLRPHDCGEMGQYCDSDWHREKKPGWVCSTFGEYVGGKHNPFTHWRPLPGPPAIRRHVLEGDDG